VGVGNQDRAIAAIARVPGVNDFAASIMASE
jgi:hypothetical protein